MSVFLSLVFHHPHTTSLAFLFLTITPLLPNHTREFGFPHVCSTPCFEWPPSLPFFFSPQFLSTSTAGCNGEVTSLNYDKC